MNKKMSKIKKTPIKDSVLDDVFETVDTSNQIEETNENELEIGEDVLEVDDLDDVFETVDTSNQIEETNENELENDEDTLENVEALVDPVKIIEEFSEASKKIDEQIVSTMKQDELEEVLIGEVNRVESVEQQLKEHINKTEQDLLKKGRKFSNFWNGVNTGLY